MSDRQITKQEIEVINKAIFAKLIQEIKNQDKAPTLEQKALLDKLVEELIEKEDKFIVNTSELATIFGVTTRQIGAWVKLGMPKLKHGMYNLAECVQWRIRAVKYLQFNKLTPKGRIELAVARKKEIEARMLAGELIKTKDVENFIHTLLSFIHDNVQMLIEKYKVVIQYADIWQNVTNELRVFYTKILEFFEKFKEDYQKQLENIKAEREKQREVMRQRRKQGKAKKEK